MKKGYIKLWRKSKDSTIFAHEGLWKLWCLCLMKANHRGAEVSVPGILKPVRLQPGQFITGRNSLHYDYHQGHLKKKYRCKAAPSVITIYRWLIQLENMQLLNIKAYNKYSIITISNWNQYQEHPSRTPENSKNGHSLTDKRAISVKSEHKKRLKIMIYQLVSMMQVLNLNNR